MKIFKSRIFIFLLGLLITSGIVYAATTASESISYGNGTVKDALDYLYGAPQIQKFCEYQDNTYVKEENKSDMYAIATKYRCQVNNNDIYNFYILSVNNEQVELIMDRNITQGTSTPAMTWANAIKYANDNLKSNWINVLDVDLPKVQTIANAVGNNSWNAATSTGWWYLDTKNQTLPTTTNSLWLWDYTRECQNWGCSNSLEAPEAYGYWTRDIIIGSSYVWRVNRKGEIPNDTTSTNNNGVGVRPVITVLKANLYKNN